MSRLAADQPPIPRTPAPPLRARGLQQPLRAHQPLHPLAVHRRFGLASRLLAQMREDVEVDARLAVWRSLGRTIEELQ